METPSKPNGGRPGEFGEPARPGLPRLLAIGLLICPILAWIDVLLGAVLPASGQIGRRELFIDLAASLATFCGLYLLGTVAALLLARVLRRSVRSSVAVLIGILAGLIALQVLRQFFQGWLAAGRIVPGLIWPMLGVALLALLGRSGIFVLLNTSFHTHRGRVLAAIPGGAILVGFLAIYRPGPAPAAAAAVRDASPRPRCVILLTIDTLRADLVDLDPPGINTPNIAALAKDSVVFERAISPAPWTLPSFASIHTGLAPRVHQTLSFRSRLPDACPTLAESLRRAGYATAAIGTNPYLNAAFGLDRGFERYTMFPIQLSATVGSEALAAAWPRQFGSEGDADTLTDLAIDWLEQHQGRPMFLWLHYFDPHLPYEPKPEYLRGREPVGRFGMVVGEEDLSSIRAGYLAPTPEEAKWLRAMQLAEVRYTDAAMGRAIAALKRLGLYDDALIVFASDHGEEFFEHGGFEHGHTIYDELLHVPLFVKLPGRSVTGRVSQAVSTVSVTPTVLEACGMANSADQFSAPPLSPFWTRGTPDGSTIDYGPIISTGCAYYEDRVAIRAEGWKYSRRFLSNQVELFDLTNDPGERRSLAGVRPEDIERFEKLLAADDEQCRALRQRLGLTDQVGSAPNEQLMRSLRSLGYVE